jgi:hypothetical protein
MVFPQTILPIKVEALLSGVWTDITTYVYQRSDISIQRGRDSEGSTAQPSSCTMVLDNRDRRFSPRNPLGAYYGTIGRNTQTRVSLPSATSWLYLSGVPGDCITAPDNARLDITGDIEIQIDAWLPSWIATTDLIGKYNATGNQRSYELFVYTSGVLAYAWSTDGTNAGKTIISSTAVIPAPITGRKAVKVTHDVNNGASGNTVTFYYSDTINGTWIQLGNPVITAGTTSIYNSTSSLYIGDIAGVNGGVININLDAVTYVDRMKVYAAKVLSGIGGSVKANPYFTTQADGTTSFADAAGNTWTVQGSATIIGREYKCYGEVSEWPTYRDLTGRDVYTNVTSSGIMRRLNAGSKALKSAYYRGVTSTVAPITALRAYWPCEDGTAATSIASGLSGHTAMRISGTPVLATDSSSYACSAPLPTMGTASFTGKVKSYVSTGQIQVKVLIAIPAAGIISGAVLLSLRCGGTATRWEVVYTTASAGTLTVNAYNTSGASILSSGTSFNATGSIFRLCLSVVQNGTGVDWVLSGLSPGYQTGGTLSGNLASNTVTAASQVIIAPNKNCTDATMGHVTVQSLATSTFDLSNQLAAYNGEVASSRFRRLCYEENINVSVRGDDPYYGVRMGPQLQQTLMSLLQEIETIDGGIIYEPREFFGLVYRSSRSLCTQDAIVSLSYSSGDLSQFQPLPDDRNIVNDIVVSRIGVSGTGSSAHVSQDTGALSTQDPPNGVGVYDRTLSVNSFDDDILEDVAGWHVHLGTVDEERYPSLPINLARSNFSTNPDLMLAATTVSIGDRISITGPPSDLPPDTINQMVIGIDETLNAYVHTIDYTCQPESPYHIGVWGDSASRYSSGGSTVNGAHNSSTTTLSVATAGSTLWGHSDGNFGIMVGGEEMTVTAVAATASPQNFTVVRHVNGITKSQTSGTVVSLFDPCYWSL